MLTQDELEINNRLELDLADEIAMQDSNVAEQDWLEKAVVALAKQLKQIPVRQAVKDGLKMSRSGARRFWAAYVSPVGTSDADLIAILKGKK